MRFLLRVAVLVAVAAVAGCQAASAAEPAEPAYGPGVVHFGGVGDIGFGQTTGELRERGRLLPGTGACMATLAEVAASPVFADDRLVLLWAEPPLSTPEGVTVGTPLALARAAYPGAVDLTAPAGSHRFDGLLVGRAGRAYLFLHDGETVRKTIAGYEEYARRLFASGFGTC